MSLPTASELADRLAAVRAAVEQVERPWTHPVAIVAVTKGFGPEAIELAVEAGCTAVGENYAQELVAKRGAIESARAEHPVEVHFIGHLQSNKVRQIAGLVDLWETIDRSSIATEIARRRPGGRVLVQVNATREDSKSGCAPADVAALVADVRGLGLDVAGLMTIGPTDGHVGRARAAFERTRALVDELGLEVCSMGMSGDYELAVACGSTQLRLGSALLGPRPPR